MSPLTSTLAIWRVFLDRGNNRRESYTVNKRPGVATKPQATPSSICVVFDEQTARLVAPACLLTTSPSELRPQTIHAIHRPTPLSMPADQTTTKDRDPVAQSTRNSLNRFCSPRIVGSSASNAEEPVLPCLPTGSSISRNCMFVTCPSRPSHDSFRCKRCKLP